MKAELRLQEHSVLPGHKVIEIWHEGRLIGTVTGADGPGVKVISKHPLKPVDSSGLGVANVVQVDVDVTRVVVV